MAGFHHQYKREEIGKGKKLVMNPILYSKRKKKFVVEACANRLTLAHFFFLLICCAFFSDEQGTAPSDAPKSHAPSIHAATDPADPSDPTGGPAEPSDPVSPVESYRRTQIPPPTDRKQPERPAPDAVPRVMQTNPCRHGIRDAVTPPPGDPDRST